MLGISKQYTPSSIQVSNSAAYNIDIAALFNAISGLENQTSSLGGLTITPTANTVTTFKVTNVAGAAQIYVDTLNSSIIDSSTLGISSTYGIYHDRGDIGSADFVSLTIDGNWHDLDLSGIVSSSAKSVIVQMTFKTTFVSDTAGISFRKKGKTNADASIPVLVANLTHNSYVIVPCDSNKFIQYNSGIAMSPAQIIIKGWFQ